MLKLPLRQPLKAQTAEILREHIAQGMWRDWLPGERQLCEMLQVGRATLRAALEQLSAAGELSREQGRGNRILTKPAQGRAKPLASLDVGLLIPRELSVLVPSQVMWIDYLRAMLAERGCRLHVFHGRKYMRTDPARLLRDLTTRHQHRCWILLRSSRAVQEWFQANHVPCVVAGSLYSGVSLPFCDIDHHAMCRHAARIFLARGHRRLALIVQKSQLAGDLESEAGFREGTRQTNAEVMVGYHDATNAGIVAVVRRLMQRREPPTAFLVVNSFHYLSAVGALARLGYRLPEDISTIARDSEPFLMYLLPEPANYGVDPRLFAKTLLVQVLQLLEGGVATKRTAQIMPDFHPGQSLTKIA